MWLTQVHFFQGAFQVLLSDICYTKTNTELNSPEPKVTQFASFTIVNNLKSSTYI